MHPTSFAGPYGIGEIGKEAYAFIDFLEAAHMQIWQMLPLVPPGRPIPGVREDYWSPYSGQDASAGFPLLIELQGLVDAGLLAASDLPAPCYQLNVDWEYVVKEKEPLLGKAAKALLASTEPKVVELRKEYEAWRAEADTQEWLEAAAIFSAISGRPENLGKDWWSWTEELRDRDEAALAAIAQEQKAEIDEYCVLQFLFDSQWAKIKAYANAKGVKLLGDMPIYVGGHSADVWCNRELWTLDDKGLSAAVSGVPPDAFSDDGQLWGSPLYDWAAHEKEGFAWWTRRLRRACRLYDETRIDHFRGLAGYWAVDATSDTAKFGKWKVGPGVKLFEALKKNLGDVTIVAEDLGVITPDVVELREEIGAPGMVVLQFAFDGDGTNVHRPHNHYENSICYPGTHDNDTAVGWYKGTSPETRATFKQYSGMEDERKVAWEMIRVGMASVSHTCIFCFQDILSLGNDARMNTPGVADGNWVWRCRGFNDLDKEAAKLRLLCDIFDRQSAAVKADIKAKKDAEKAAEAAN